MNITQSTFLNCTTGRFGGAVGAISGAMGGISETLFSDCWCRDGDHPAIGGAAYLIASVDLRDCTFLRCSADSGAGALYAENVGTQTQIVSGCVFRECDSSAGGAVDFGIGTGDSPFSVVDCSFIDCRAFGENGGGKPHTASLPTCHYPILPTCHTLICHTLICHTLICHTLICLLPVSRCLSL